MASDHLVLGPVSLTVQRLGAMAGFYEQVVGLALLRSEDTVAELGTADGEILVRLHEDAAAVRPQAGAAGLYHLALLVPGRRQLAWALRRIIASGWTLTGASDHLVSEALYLQDPEGNGLEIYRDRPREDWPRGPAGELQMASLPLDLDALLAELPRGEAQPAMDAATRIGHVHLHVQDLAEAERFYAGELGFEVTVRGYPGALFLSRHGYHHHIAVNTWSGRAGAPPPGSLGLRGFELRQAGADEVRTDPSGNRVLLRAG